MQEGERAAGERLLAALGWKERFSPRIMVVVAHPDDETIGLGGHLAALPRLRIVHATDGAPRNLHDARAAGFADARGYAEARQRELRAAVALAGIGADALMSLGCADQEASRDLMGLTQRLTAAIAERGADIVFTHAYEGGHPDHDATAFAAHAATRLLQRQGAEPPLLVEMPLYHSEGGIPVRQCFAPDASLPVVSVDLPPDLTERKRQMYGCHATQRDTLALFHVEREDFRRAPLYDFRALPNGGEIFYESFGWGFSGADFLALAAEALDRLALPGRI